MNAELGRKWRLAIKVGAQYVTFAGAQEESMTFTSDIIDRTDEEIDGYRHVLAEGNQKMDFNLSGVAIDNSGYNALITAVRNQDIIDMQATTRNWVVTGLFAIASYSETGSDKQAVTFSASFQSDGAWSIA